MRASTTSGSEATSSESIYQRSMCRTGSMVEDYRAEPDRRLDPAASRCGALDEPSRPGGGPRSVPWVRRSVLEESEERRWFTELYDPGGLELRDRFVEIASKEGAWTTLGF